MEYEDNSLAVEEIFTNIEIERNNLKHEIKMLKLNNEILKIKNIRDIKKLKEVYNDFKQNFILAMNGIGLDHRLDYIEEQYFEDFEKAIKMDTWEEKE